MSDQLPLTGFGIAFLAVVLGAAAIVAVLPMSMAERYRRRAVGNFLVDPQQSIRDLTHALEIDPGWRLILVERARMLRLMGEYRRAAEDLREYLDRARDEPRARVIRVRSLLQHLEASAERPTSSPSTNISG